ncbi:MAG: sensor signal transduction histidine kinase [Thermoleophilia bacterium]|nr:sensor signal transduction histidine kinase [Thermoleophilia bacterium]
MQHRLRPQPWILAVALTALAVIGFVAAPSPGWREAISLAARIACVVAIGSALPRLAPCHRMFGYLLAAAMVLATTGDVIWTSLLGGPDGGAPFPSAADGFYLSAYVLTTVALVRLRPPLASDRRAGALLDAMIVMTAIGILSWELLLDADISADPVPWAGKLTSAAYPALGLLCIAVLTSMLATRVASRTILLLLAAGILSEVASDTAYALASGDGTFVPGTAMDAGWLAVYGFVAAALLHPWLRHAPEVQRPAPERHHLRMALLLVAAFCVPLLALVEGKLGVDISYRELVIEPSLMLTLVFMRMTVMNRSLVRSEHALARRHAELGEVLEDRRRLLHELVRTAEREKTRVSAELHDGPVQRLAALGYLVGQLEQAPEDDTLGEHAALVEDLVQTLSREIDGLRHIMQDLRPPALNERGLEEAIELHVQRVREQLGWQCSLDLALIERLDPAIETALYRVVQEALANAARHADADSISITLRSDDRQVLLVVEDDGRGFDHARSATFMEDGHFGLAIMRERIEAAGGTCRVASSPSRGTRISFTVPTRAFTASALVMA